MGFFVKVVLALFISMTCISSTFAEASQHKNVKRVDLVNVNEWEVSSADTGGTLLFSDSPEEAKEDGILYTDKVEGKTRLFYYHTNATNKPKKVVAVMENLTDDKVSIVVNRYALTGPSKDYLYVGKTAQKDFFDGKYMTYVHLKANQSKVIHPMMEQQKIDKDELVNGIFEFEAKTPVKVTVAIMPMNADPIEFLKTAKVLPRDKHGLRGTFTGMDRVIKSEREYDPKKDGIVSITLADGKIDQYRTGIDATDGSITENYGNYGILYKINIPTKGRASTNYYLCPRGGVYAGAIGVKDNVFNDMTVIETPSEKPFFGTEKKVDEIAYLGKYENRHPLWIEFSPPGASNLPVKLILAPVE
ncbi:copper amine oxidase [Anaerosinus sp.]|uniref:copper amine oxidase n=1 Tax=Selenobaculum sp. TaxID=3074374 RepID=UPI003AB5F5B1